MKQSLDPSTMQDKKDGMKFGSRRHVPILRYSLVTLPSTRLTPKSRTKHYYRFVRAKMKREHLVTLGRMGVLLLPSLSIPVAELSLSSLVQSPIIIPSPIGMELFDVCTSMLLYSSRGTTPREGRHAIGSLRHP